MAAADDRGENRKKLLTPKRDGSSLRATSAELRAQAAELRARSIEARALLHNLQDQAEAMLTTSDAGDQSASSAEVPLHGARPLKRRNRGQEDDRRQESAAQRDEVADERDEVADER